MKRILFIAYLLILLTGCSVSLQKQDSSVNHSTEYMGSSSSPTIVPNPTESPENPLNNESNSNHVLTNTKNERSDSNNLEIEKKFPIIEKKIPAIWLRVSKSFGTETIAVLKENTLAKNRTLLDWMRDRLPIETSYGGSFVNSIHGIRSGFTDQSLFSRNQVDWFFYVNGQLSPIGATDVVLGPGDRVIWDYHVWDSGNPAQSEIIGAFPQPFSGVATNQEIVIKTTEAFIKTKQKSLNLFQSWLEKETSRKNKIEKIDMTSDFDKVQGAPQIWLLDAKTANTLSAMTNLLTDSSNSPLIYPKLPDEETRVWMQAVRSVNPDSMPVWLIVFNQEGDFDQLFEFIQNTDLWQGWFGLRLVATPSKSILKPLLYASQEEATE